MYDLSEAETLIRYVLEDFAGVKRWQQWSDETVQLSQDQIFKLQEVLDRLCKGEPYQYILGKQLFAGQWFEVNGNVLIPRPETEELFQLVVEWCKKRSFAPDTIIDHCTGSGCLAVSLKKAFPNARVMGTDVSEKALDVAKKNAKALNAPVEFIQVDLLKPDVAQHLPESVDVIVSNPPYVLLSEAKAMHVNVLKYEPHIALFVPYEDPLIFYRRILEISVNTLNQKGLMAFEINPLYYSELKELFSKFFLVELLKDLSGKNRFLFATKQTK
ncbi:release factor glutamine methyltransferase [Thermaurantimonas aggregans]|uniref:peptide chain release factor N(5)-glutamine methyltransferase n=2 Tax=Thermaurantimonas aggregans TaxID=2173829 RepID=A0A401XNF5_9FLAO|nr:release factor glutamine methyltransferase [Thermaurantimonas aggregans]